MEMKSLVTKVIICNILLVSVLLLVPVEAAKDLCLFKKIFGINCWNCGMTRALVSVAYLDFYGAWHYNRAVIVVAPLLVWLWGKWVWQLAKKRQ